jgi:GT2 family glycosyltransferase
MQSSWTSYPVADMREGTHPRVGVVVPTLGTRAKFLEESLRSIRAGGPCHITVVRPRSSVIETEILDLADQVLDDPGRGLAAAINSGIRALPTSVRFATWLGDDDRLTKDSLAFSSAALERGAVFAFGGCRYIDEDGNELWLNGSGRWTLPLMRCGPQLVPQPGSLFDRQIFEEIGGLDESYNWAFDLDLFLRLLRHGRAVYVDQTLAEFRWHPGSLSVGSRRGSVAEASAIRRRSMPRPLRALSVLWEPAVRRLILHAGERMTRRLSRSRQR